MKLRLSGRASGARPRSIGPALARPTLGLRSGRNARPALLRYRRLSPAARIPARAHDSDAGFDLHAAEAASLPPGERASVGTGLAVAIPDGFAGLVLPRSGLAARHGVALVNAPGLIDAGYRGELRVLLLNTDREAAFEVAEGDRVAQLVLVRAEPVELEETDELADTARGVGGFGSSGR